MDELIRRCEEAGMGEPEIEAAELIAAYGTPEIAIAVFFEGRADA